MRKRAPKRARRKASVSDQGLRTWGNLSQCLRWLKDEGYDLARKNAYAHYGRASSHPVQRDKAGRWFYQELLERVRQNVSRAKVDYSQLSRVALARQMAELRIKNAMAKQRELRLAEYDGSLIQKASVHAAMTRAAAEIETGRKNLTATLPPVLVGKPEREIYALIEKELKGWLASICDRFAELGR
jgi:hypothetical protein